jgi:sialate O-acetylesterase
MQLRLSRIIKLINDSISARYVHLPLITNIKLNTMRLLPALSTFSSTLLTTFCLASPMSLHAAVALGSPFGDHGVLQRDKPIAVWGTAEIGEKVTVALDGPGKKNVSMITGADGKWLVHLPARPAGGPYTLTVTGTNTLTLRDIYLGEVWICSGQSNMQWTVSKAANPDAEIADSAQCPLIRHYKVANKTAATPQTTCAGAWAVAGPTTTGQFTAVGYFFARKLQQELQVPIGLLHTSWGGTPAEAWTSESALKSSPTFNQMFHEWEKQMAEYPTALEKYNAELALWATTAEEAKKSGKIPPIKPRQPNAPNSPQNPASLYNGMIAPLLPYTVRGAIWYQGESNADRANKYQALLSLMIQDWRSAFQQGDFSFYLVQLANFRKRNSDPVDTPWANLRWAQYQTTRTTTRTGLAVAIDVGEENDIHPKNKQTVGERLARAALAKDYGKNVVYSGPTFQSLTIDGNKAVLQFEHIGGGLITADGGALSGFAIAGENGKYVWANAEIVGDTVVVSSDKITIPKHVRYAWGDNPACNLINKAGLPAVPFATDK